MHCGLITPPPPSKPNNFTFQECMVYTSQSVDKVGVHQLDLDLTISPRVVPAIQVSVGSVPARGYDGFPDGNSWRYRCKTNSITVCAP